MSTHIDLHPVSGVTVSTVSDNLGNMAEPEVEVPAIIEVHAPNVAPSPNPNDPATIAQREQFLRQSITQIESELANMNSAEAVAVRLKTVRTNIAHLRSNLEDAEKTQRGLVEQGDAQLMQLKADIPSLHMSNGFFLTMSPDGRRRFDARLADYGQTLLAEWRAGRNVEDVRRKLEEQKSWDQPLEG